ncbi:unnamed protein product [Camellia sinensis]
MTLVTTMKAINEKILSLDYGNYKAEIKTVDAQESYKKGVIVLVTGCLTGKDNVRKKFTETFFLAPQKKNYFVLNDVVRYVENYDLPTQKKKKKRRYVEESESLEVINSVTVNNGINNNNASMSPLPLDPEPIRSPDHPPLEPVATFQTEDLNNGPEVCDPSDHEEGSVLGEKVIDEPPTHSSQIETNTVVTSDPSDAHEQKNHMLQS